MPSKLIPKDHLKEMAPKNKEWFEKYKTKTPSYYTNIQEFLEFCAYKNDKYISQLDKTDIDSYFKTLKEFHAKPPTIHGRYSALSDFRNFLHALDSYTFDEKYLSAILDYEQIEIKKPTIKKALSLTQVKYVREYNHLSAKSVKDEYIFELFFQLGIREIDLVACKFPKNKSAVVEEFIKKVPKGSIKVGTINSYLQRITNHLKKIGLYDENGRLISSGDLTENHEAYCLQCPNCKISFENIPENWVLTRTESDQDFRLYCSHCKWVPNVNGSH